MTPINTAIKAAGVVWHDCSECGRSWPFPKGVQDDREWMCSSCVQARWARVERAKVNVVAFVNAIGEVTKSEAIAAIEQEWKIS